jgi:hypothetical protein
MFLSEFGGTELVLFSVIYTLILSWSKLIGGVLFGVAFFVIARKVRHKNTLRKYAIISAYGYMLLFASNQAIVLLSAPYPPFGLATISFVGLSSYLALVGIYSSAISVSQEINLRKTIRKTVLKDSNLLNSIGFAEGEKAFLRKVVGIAKEQIDKMSNETGVRFLEEEDTKQYLDEVLKEIKDKKSRDMSG